MRLGGAEDPSSLQSSSAPRSLSNGSSDSATSNPHKGSTSFANGALSKVGSNGHSNGQAVTRPSGPFFGHDREQVTRILIQSLTDLGYHGAAGTLSRESGYELENPSVAAFRNAVQAGEWAEAEALLFGSSHMNGVELGDGSLENGQRSHNGTGKRRRSKVAQSSPTSPVLPLSEGVNKREMLFSVRQQKYLELLEERDLGSALMVLRHELTPLHEDIGRLHALSSLMMCQSAEDLRQQAQWDGSAGESRGQLLSELSKSIAPSVMIPEHRLAVLLDQVQKRQVDHCLYHNTTDAPSLYQDHACDQEDFPMQPLVDLQDHSDEVWYVDFSHDGSMLASASGDGSIVVYDTTSWRPLIRLSDSRAMPDVQGVCYVAWCPNDRLLLSCSRGNDLTVYDVKNNGSRSFSITKFDQPVTSAAWAPDGQTFVVSSHDPKSALEIYSLADAAPVASLARDGETLRVSDVSFSADGTRLAAVTLSDKRLIVYDYMLRELIADWTMEDTITCVNLSRDGKFALVSMNNSKLVLLDVATGEITQRYTGLKQKNFVIRSNFGGAGENFVVSGSEDSHVYIWRKHSGTQVAALQAHGPGTVNSVAWHPTNPAIFASAGDDKSVRIWSNYETVRTLGPQLGLRPTVGGGGGAGSGRRSLSDHHHHHHHRHAYGR